MPDDAIPLSVDPDAALNDVGISEPDPDELDANLPQPATVVDPIPAQPEPAATYLDEGFADDPDLTPEERESLLAAKAFAESGVIPEMETVVPAVSAVEAALQASETPPTVVPEPLGAATEPITVTFSEPAPAVSIADAPVASDPDAALDQGSAEPVVVVEAAPDPDAAVDQDAPIPAPEAPLVDAAPSEVVNLGVFDDTDLAPPTVHENALPPVPEPVTPEPEVLPGEPVAEAPQEGWPESEAPLPPVEDVPVVIAAEAPPAPEVTLAEAAEQVEIPVSVIADVVAEPATLTVDPDAAIDVAPHIHPLSPEALPNVEAPVEDTPPIDSAAPLNLIAAAAVFAQGNATVDFLGQALTQARAEAQAQLNELTTRLSHTLKALEDTLQNEVDKTAASKAALEASVNGLDRVRVFQAGAGRVVTAVYGQGVFVETIES